MQSEQLFEAALGVSSPWYVVETRFDTAGRMLTIFVDFHSGSRFSHPDAVGEHPVHDTQTKRYRHLNFFQHECYLEVRVPRGETAGRLGAAGAAAVGGQAQRFHAVV